MTLNGVLLWIRNSYIRTTSKIRKQKINKTDFTIISNNCWSGIIYESYGLPKQSPTVGMFFMAEEYLKFVSNLKYYVEDCELCFIDPEQSRHKEFYKKNKKFGTYLIGRLDDVEITMLHFHSKEEATLKWKRRCERINWDHMIVKMNDQNGCKKEYAEQFMKLPFENKLFFTVKNWSDIKGITILNSKNKDCCGMFDEPFGSSKKMNINQLINKI